MPAGNGETGELLSQINIVKEDPNASTQLKGKLRQFYLEISNSYSELIKLRDEVQVEKARVYVDQEKVSLIFDL